MPYGNSSGVCNGASRPDRARGTPGAFPRTGTGARRSQRGWGVRLGRALVYRGPHRRAGCRRAPGTGARSLWCGAGAGAGGEPAEGGRPHRHGAGDPVPEVPGLPPRPVQPVPRRQVLRYAPGGRGFRPLRTARRGFLFRPARSRLRRRRCPIGAALGRHLVDLEGPYRRRGPRPGHGGGADRARRRRRSPRRRGPGGGGDRHPGRAPAISHQDGGHGRRRRSKGRRQPGGHGGRRAHRVLRFHAGARDRYQGLAGRGPGRRRRHVGREPPARARWPWSSGARSS